MSMRSIVWLVLASGFTGVGPGVTPVAASGAVEAAQGVLERLIPAQADQFTLEAIPPEKDRDVFEIEARDGKVTVRGSSGVAIASGIGWYLKHHCHCDFSWCGDQLRLPEPLPALEEKIRRATPYPHRYFFNYCVFSYTLAWWDWPQWERMIDWMALNGINMPLAVTGQEAIWQAVGRRFGLSDAEIGEFMVGPAYLPFGWMGCMDGWGGPLPQSWIDSHRELQEKILARQRQLGMTPVLQGFTGHVPVAMQKKFPQATFRQLPSWCGFPGTLFLDPLDPLFREFGKAFVEEQTRLFGTDHFYASDTFIEMSPPSNEPKFLDDMGKAVFGAMEAADPQATWVMQGWLFVNNPGYWKPPQAEALLRSVPQGRMLVLDLMCESSPAWKRTEAFYGNPWVFCIIQTFGDVVSLHGGLPQIAANLRAAHSPQAGQLRGIGHIMEGLGCNPVIHDFLADMTWRSEVPEVEDWLAEYVHRRYGQKNPKADEAWRLLLASAYSTPGAGVSPIQSRPGLNVRGGGKPRKIAEAWQVLLEADDDLKAIDTYQFDLVNVSREALSGLAGPLCREILAAYKAKDRAALAAAGKRLLELVDDLDELLATRRELLLGRWIADARRWATHDDERRLYEWNARNQITLWGPEDSVLHEYARKQWAGMMRGFYGQRWKIFLDRLDAALAANQPFDAVGFEKEIRAWEAAWTHGSESYAVEPQGDPAAVSRRLWEKYAEAFAVRKTASLTTDMPVTCSHALPAYPAALANDGWADDTDSYWATDVGGGGEAWWQVDLEKPTTVGRVTPVFFFGDHRWYGFTIETSLDGQQWEMVADRRDNREPSTPEGIPCTFTPRPARYIRVTLTHNSANTGRHLVEVLAFEK